MDTLTQRALQALLFSAGLLALPAVWPELAHLLADYRTAAGVTALLLLAAAALLARAVRREAQWNNPALARPPRQEP